MVERNKYGPLPSTAILLIISVFDRKPQWKKLSYSEIFEVVKFEILVV